MLLSLAIIGASYIIGSVPVAYLTGRATRGVDIREYGSGNAGASNIWQSVSKTLVVPVGLAQIAQGLVPVLIAKAADQGDAVQVAAGIAAIVANDWNPWLRFSGGRGIGPSIGVLLALSPAALAVFVAVALVGVALRVIPQFVALALVLAPLGAAVRGDGATIVAGCALLALVALTKRLLANGRPDRAIASRSAWANRLLLDRDIRDREAWVRRRPAG